MKKLICYLLTLLFIALLSACGSGPPPVATSSSIKAVIKTTALTADRNIAGIDLTISVPLGVTPPFLPPVVAADGTVIVQADPAATVEVISSNPQNQVLTGATYTPPSVETTGQLAISVIVAAGFAATDQITIHLNVAPGTIPLVTDFNLLSFTAFDTNGAVVTGLTPTLTTTIQ